jgi:hypothetical protein
MKWLFSNKTFKNKEKPPEEAQHVTMFSQNHVNQD